MTAVIGSLCSGYGGLEMGLSLALGGDTRTAWHVEYDKHPAAILTHRFPGVPNHGDVKTTDWTQVEPVDWLTAGYPCQPFSLAGKRQGADDPRHLWPGVLAAIRVVRPRLVLLENVAAHLRLGFDTVLGDLAVLGYSATWGVVRASDAGAPHGRARLFVVAVDADTTAQRRRRAARQLGGLGAAGLLADSAPDAPHDGQSRRGGARAGWAGPADGGVPAADTTGDARRIGDGDAGPTSADTPDDRRQGALSLASDSSEVPQGTGQPGRARGDHLGVAWGAYEPAVRRWEAVTGRPAPRPTEPGRRGERLSPRFVEWMMGLPDGWVTDVPGLPRNAQLKALGNGVVPQQAALAVRLLTEVEQVAV